MGVLVESKVPIGWSFPLYTTLTHWLVFLWPKTILRWHKHAHICSWDTTCMQQAENFQGRKLAWILRICKSFLRKILGMASFCTAKASNTWTFSLQKSYFSPIWKNSLKSFPLYASLTHILSLLEHAHKHLFSHTESQTPLCFLLLGSVWLPGGSSR